MLTTSFEEIDEMTNNGLDKDEFAFADKMGPPIRGNKTNLGLWPDVHFADCNDRIKDEERTGVVVMGAGGHGRSSGITAAIAAATMASSPSVCVVASDESGNTELGRGMAKPYYYMDPLDQLEMVNQIAGLGGDFEGDVSRKLNGIAGDAWSNFGNRESWYDDSMKYKDDFLVTTNSKSTKFWSGGVDIRCETSVIKTDKDRRKKQLAKKARRRNR